MIHYSYIIKQQAENLLGPKAAKIRFKNAFDADESFIERGMVAWFTGFEWDSRKECYQLFFDFSDFMCENSKYFREIYYENDLTKKLGVQKKFYTALETGDYNPKYWVYFSAEDGKNDDNLLCELITKHFAVEE